MEKIFSLLEIPDSVFELFMEETGTLFDKLKHDLKELRNCDIKTYRLVIDRMFRQMHTIKGNSKLLKLNSIQDVAHDVESFLASLKNGDIEFSPDVISSLMEKLMEVNEEIYSYTSLRREFLGRAERKSNLAQRYRVQWIKSLIHQFSTEIRGQTYNVREFSRIQFELSRALSSFDKVLLVEYLERYDVMMESIADQVGKKISPLKHKLECLVRPDQVLMFSSVQSLLGHYTQLKYCSHFLLIVVPKLPHYFDYHR